MPTIPSNLPTIKTRYFLIEQLPNNGRGVKVTDGELFTQPLQLPEKLEIPSDSSLRRIQSAAVIGAKIAEGDRENPPTIRVTSQFHTSASTKKTTRVESRYHATFMLLKNGNVYIMDGAFILIDEKSKKAYMLGTDNIFTDIDSLVAQSHGKRNLSATSNGQSASTSIMIRNSTNGTFVYSQVPDAINILTDQTVNRWVNLRPINQDKPGGDIRKIEPDALIKLGGTTDEHLTLWYVLEEEDSGGRVKRFIPETLGDK